MNLKNVKTLVKTRWIEATAINFVLAVIFHTVGYMDSGAMVWGALGWLYNILTIGMLFIYMTIPHHFQQLCLTKQVNGEIENVEKSNVE